MLKKLKLAYYRWKLSQAYYHLDRLQNNFGCGIKLTTYIHSEIGKASKQVDDLFAKCKELERS